VTRENDATLPEFTNPPVVEVACGVLFQPLVGFTLPYVGRLWEHYGTDKYPRCQEVAPVLPTIEKYDGTDSADMMSVQHVLLPRTWFINQDDTALIQVQRDRFLTNWRKVRPSDMYPRFHTVIKDFTTNLELFTAFVTKYGLGLFSPLQYELTYVNHIVKGQGWDNLSDVAELLPDYSWRNSNGRFLPACDRINWVTSFPLPHHSGRLHAKIYSALTAEGGQELIVIEMVARGIDAPPTNNSMSVWFDMAHEWIVRGFADITGSKTQQSIWKRTR
jgi:uncharacterized protein (TIGR04255 family)